MSTGRLRGQNAETGTLFDRHRVWHVDRLMFAAEDGQTVPADDHHGTDRMLQALDGDPAVNQISQARGLVHAQHDQRRACGPGQQCSRRMALHAGLDDFRARVDADQGRGHFILHHAYRPGVHFMERSEHDAGQQLGPPAVHDIDPDPTDSTLAERPAQGGQTSGGTVDPDDDAL